VPITNFEDRPDQSIWGLEHGIGDERGGVVTHSVVQGLSSENNPSNILQVDYDVSNNDMSLVAWFQTLGVPTGSGSAWISSFNAKAMNIKSLSFFAIGDKGGEKMCIDLLDASGQGSESGVEITLTNSWTEYKIILTNTTNGTVNLSELVEFSLTIFNGLGPDTGKFFVDDFAFEW